MLWCPGQVPQGLSHLDVYQAMEPEWLAHERCTFKQESSNMQYHKNAGAPLAAAYAQLDTSIAAVWCMLYWWLSRELHPFLSHP